MILRAGVTVDDLVKKKISWTCRESNLRLSTHTIATVSIMLVGVGQTIEDITCCSLTWIPKQVPDVTGVVFLWGAELSCLDCSVSAFNVRDFPLRRAVDQDTVPVIRITSEHNVIQVQCVHRLLEWRKPKEAEWGYVFRSWKWLTNSRNTMSCFVFVQSLQNLWQMGGRVCCTFYLWTVRTLRYSQVNFSEKTRKSCIYIEEFSPHPFLF